MHAARDQRLECYYRGAQLRMRELAQTAFDIQVAQAEEISSSSPKGSNQTASLLTDLGLNADTTCRPLLDRLDVDVAHGSSARPRQGGFVLVLLCLIKRN